MSMNILVETRIAPEITFKKENPTLMAGEIAINKEGNSAKIGDGIKKWNELESIITSNEIIDKWLKIAEGTTNSHLVTLPDMNFAYSVITVDSNSMIEEVVRTIIQNNDYFSIIEKPKENIGSKTDVDGVLVLSAGGVQDISFDTIGEEKKSIISQISFENNKKTESRTYTIYDRDAQSKIDNILDRKLPIIETSITDIKDILNDPNRGINEINKKLVAFTLNKNGLVKAPTEAENSENYFLTGKNTWKRITLDAASVSTNDGSGTV